MILARREQAETFGVAANFDGKYISHFQKESETIVEEKRRRRPDFEPL